MIIYDPLYGRFEIPTYLNRLLMTPELRRLSQIRLLNTLTPSLATLGELRRYSHTLGVLYLCIQNSKKGYSEIERKALLASALIHDIGTPPFGHLLEYQLYERKGFDHEKIIRSLIMGSATKENLAHQIFGGRTIEFRRELEKAKIPLEMVEIILTGKHPLSKYLFGTLDFDNIDNVARMAWSLGILRNTISILNIAKGLYVDRECRLILSEDEYKQYIVEWADIREKVYNILVFDGPTVSAQAILSDAIRTAIDEEILSSDDWDLSDEELIERLRKCNSTKNSIVLNYLGRLPNLSFCIQISGALGDYGINNTYYAKKKIEEALQNEFPKDRPLGYVFIDHGAFQKELKFIDPKTNKEWRYGKQSSSICLYGFLKSQKPPSMQNSNRAIQSLLESMGVHKEKIIRVLRCLESGINYDQQTFNF